MVSAEVFAPLEIEKLRANGDEICSICSRVMIAKRTCTYLKFTGCYASSLTHGC